jgi:hypothetical protein
MESASSSALEFMAPGHRSCLKVKARQRQPHQLTSPRLVSKKKKTDISKTPTVANAMKSEATNKLRGLSNQIASEPAKLLKGL